MIVKLPFPASALFPNRRLGQHWAKTNVSKVWAKDYAFYATKAVIGTYVPKDGPIALSVVFCPPDKRRRDADGMLSALKHALDGVALALGIDDSRFRPILIDVGPVAKNGCVIVAVGVQIVQGIEL